MHVFVTGSTGFIGTALVKELLEAGHTVTGLARSDAGAAALTAAGAKVQRGTIEDLDVLREGAAKADGVAHLAFKHDFTDFQESCRLDREAISALASSLEGSNKPLVMSSGVLLLPGGGHISTEDDTPDPNTPLAFLRGQSETLTKGLAAKGVRSAVVRFPPTVHGDGDKGLIPIMIKTAREKGVAPYVGDGHNRWPSVHRLDAANLFRLALEKAPAGSVLHCIAEEGTPMKDIAGVIGQKLNVPVTGKTMEEAQEHFGWLAFGASADNPSSSNKTRELLGWRPKQRSLMSDLKEGTYFSA